jgi:hypothetical protein
MFMSDTLTLNTTALATNVDTTKSTDGTPDPNDCCVVPPGGGGDPGPGGTT